MLYGFYYSSLMDFPLRQGKEEKRFVRVWLPPDYDFGEGKPHPVIYMSDGQNLVDVVYSAYGDWHLDRVLHDLEREGLPMPILVGIDCPKDPLQRCNELNPPYPVKEKYVRNGGPNAPYADAYVDFVADTLRPLIDSLFHTDKRKEATAIGGSSMGGIMAFYALLRRKDVFGFSLCFSIPFYFYDDARWLKILDELDCDPLKTGRLAMFVGGQGFEKMFVKGAIFMEKHLRFRGFDEKRYAFYHDPDCQHHEEAWSTYSKPAFRFWLEELK